MKYSLDFSSSYISWLRSAHGPTIRFSAVVCLVSGGVLVRRGLARSDMSSVSGIPSVAVRWKEPRAQRRGLSYRANDCRLLAEPKGKEGPKVKDDLDDIPMAYLLYVLLAILAVLAGAIIVVVKML